MRTVAAVPTKYRAVYKSMTLNLEHLFMKHQFTSRQALVKTELTESARDHW